MQAFERASRFQSGPVLKPREKLPLDETELQVRHSLCDSRLKVFTVRTSDCTSRSPHQRSPSARSRAAAEVIWQ